MRGELFHLDCIYSISYIRNIFRISEHDILRGCSAIYGGGLTNIYIIILDLIPITRNLYNIRNILIYNIRNTHPTHDPDNTQTQHTYNTHNTHHTTPRTTTHYKHNTAHSYVVIRSLNYSLMKIYIANFDPTLIIRRRI